MTRHSRRQGEWGFSLIEMMIAIVILSVVMGAAVSLMRSQSRNFARGGNRMELTQNLRYTVSSMERLVRTLGGGIGTGQPMLVYAGNDVFTFNGNYASRLPDGVAVYINPDIPAAAELGMTTASPITLPNVSPTITYPVANYFWGGATPSRAETISIYFRPDSSTADANDFVMLQRINATRSELIARNIRAYPGRPFFEYWWDSTTALGVTTYKQLAPARIPVRNLVIGGATSLADSIRTIRLNLVVTNGDLTADSTSRRVSTMFQIPNNGLAPITTCGDTPLQPSGALATDTVGQGSGGVRLSWSTTPDELGGERDITQYNLYYRRPTVPTWTPLTTQAPGFSPYSTSVTLTPDSTYIFAVAALDCSPAESPLVTSAATRLQP
jgi:prepilin-type N-terminal cleavage/methylation domain-containing protein